MHEHDSSFRSMNWSSKPCVLIDYMLMSISICAETKSMLFIPQLWSDHEKWHGSKIIDQSINQLKDKEPTKRTHGRAKMTNMTCGQNKFSLEEVYETIIHKQMFGIGNTAGNYSYMRVPAHPVGPDSVTEYFPTTHQDPSKKESENKKIVQAQYSSSSTLPFLCKKQHRPLF